MKNYIYNRYGSSDSTDKDAIIFLNELPEKIEDRKNLTNDIKKEFGSDWNLILAREEHGIIIDCTYPKSSPDNLNNSLFYTYKNHEQIYDCIVNRPVKRNKILCYYRAINTILTHITRTDYRSIVRPTMHYSFGLDVKLENLLKVDFNNIDSFNQKNSNDKDIWKILCFYTIQALSLMDSNEVYSKQEALLFSDNAYPFLYRKDDINKLWLNSIVETLIFKLKDLNYRCDDQFIYFEDDVADMKNLI